MPEQDSVGQKSEKKHRPKSIGTPVMLEDRNLKCNHAVISMWSIPDGGHEVIFLATSGLRKEYGFILAVEAIFYVLHTYGIYVLYFVLLLSK